MILLLSCDQNDDVLHDMSRLQNVAFVGGNISAVRSVDSIIACDKSTPSHELLDFARARPTFLPFGVELNAAILRFVSQVYLFDIVNGGSVKLWQAFSVKNGSPIIKEIGIFYVSHPNPDAFQFSNLSAKRSLDAITLR